MLNQRYKPINQHPVDKDVYYSVALAMKREAICVCEGKVFLLSLTPKSLAAYDLGLTTLLHLNNA